MDGRSFIAVLLAGVLTAATGLDGRWATLAIASGVCYALMLATTLVGNMTINVRVFRWDEEQAIPISGGCFVTAGTGCMARGSCSTGAGFVLIVLAALHA